MGTRTRTRTRLLDAADELLFTYGIANTPVDAILAKAGASPATLYRAYGSKEGLVAAALDRRHGAWLAVWDDAVARAPDDRGRLLAVFDALGRFRERPGSARWCAFLGTAAEFTDPPPELAAALQRETTSMADRLCELAAPVAGTRASDLADALMILATGELAMRLRGTRAPDAVTALQLADALVDHYAAGDS